MSRQDEALEFRRIFKQPVLNNISNYGSIKRELWDMQVGLINEESCEFLEAAEECYADPENMQRREELLKELSDVVFVCYQFAAAFGFNLDEAMRLVYESNLSKLDEQGNPIFRTDGKVLKGPNYAPPNLTECVPPVRLTYDDTSNGK